ncbi:alpha/beta fold hydrolase [Actinoplanes sp. NPDC026619]|uniref:alpha/beta hydrolase n=1 Tax=Actinoplanes sp. NPDC026619 TaxID=3155798 RepID=UPI0033C85828
MRDQTRFTSGDSECAAWHYPGATAACVIMAAGLGVTKEPGTDLFARRFQEAGFHVLAFDYRHFGASGGRPRQVARVREQIADWHAAIDHAATLPGVHPAQLAIWGFSTSGGHVLRVAADRPGLAAAIAQTPSVDGPAVGRNAMRHQTPAAMLRLTGRGLRDAVGALAGHPPRLVALDGPPGTVAVLTTPDAQDSGRALNPGDRYPQWQRGVAARSALRFAVYRPGRWAARVRCPLLVVVADQDQVALPGPAARAAGRAPRGELVRLPGGHYAPFLDQHEPAATAEIAFLQAHLPTRAKRPSAPAGPC